MKIAYTMMPGRGDMDRLLSTLASDLIANGLRVCGVVQSNQERPGDHPCDMDIKVLPDGNEHRISQALGKGSRGCRLDPSVLEQAAIDVERSLEAGADILLINKYGKHEAQGRGLATAIAMAVERGILVICGLNELNVEAFNTFTASEAVQLAPKLDELVAWTNASLTAAGDNERVA
ncbi:MAG: DUF2478 domain-containing protein [Hyphomicrobiales bacterium]